MDFIEEVVRGLPRSPPPRTAETGRPIRVSPSRPSTGTPSTSGDPHPGNYLFLSDGRVVLGFRFPCRRSSRRSSTRATGARRRDCDLTFTAGAPHGYEFDKPDYRGLWSCCGRDSTPWIEDQISLHTRLHPKQMGRWRASRRAGACGCRRNTSSVQRRAVGPSRCSRTWTRGSHWHRTLMPLLKTPLG